MTARLGFPLRSERGRQVMTNTHEFRGQQVAGGGGDEDLRVPGRDVGDTLSQDVPAAVDRGGRERAGERRIQSGPVAVRQASGAVVHPATV